jgi:transcriptional regulator with XRE-family HTH domain
MNLLKKYCQKQGITQTELARRAGIHTSYITHIIKGRKTPSVEVALLIERATGYQVSAIHLLGLKSQQN